METRHEWAVYSLAFASEKSRLFSGECAGEIFIHDVQTWVSYSLSFLTNRTISSLDFMFLLIYKGRNCWTLWPVGNCKTEDVVCISLKPGSDGNILATVELFSDGIFRIFDIHRSTTSEFSYLIQDYSIMTSLIKFDWLFSSSVRRAASGWKSLVRHVFASDGLVTHRSGRLQWHSNSRYPQHQYKQVPIYLYLCCT